MDFIVYGFVLLLFIISPYFLYLTRPKSKRQLPPGPNPLPIIGNLLQFGSRPHLSLTKLAQTYGSIMYMKLGVTKVIVVSSAEIAREILLKHDQSFPSRMTTNFNESHGRQNIAMAVLPVGKKWRMLRKICKENIFSTTRLDASSLLRQNELRKLCAYLQGCSTGSKVVNIGEVAFTASLNMVYNIFFSMDFGDYVSTSSSHEFKELVHGFMRLLGTLNLADVFPILRWFDPQGIRRETDSIIKKLFVIIDGIIDERLQYLLKEGSPRKNDVLQDLIDISQKDAELSHNDIKHLLLDLITGVDNPPSRVEWAMTDLLRNPNVMSKAKNELRVVLGEKKLIEESDIAKLPYLQALIKESFRYHISGPLLPRCQNEDEIEIHAYKIPRNSTILINFWAICRDPKLWSHPDSFEPERFLDSDIDIKGRHFELTPFGSGRRICPGLPLGYRMIHLMVASLIHNFDWKLEPGISPEDIDIKATYGITMEKEVPLKAIPQSI